MQVQNHGSGQGTIQQIVPVVLEPAQEAHKHLCNNMGLGSDAPLIYDDGSEVPAGVTAETRVLENGDTRTNELPTNRSRYLSARVSTSMFTL